MKVKFIKSPIGAFLLAYGEGMEGEFPEEQANLLIEAGYAVKVEEKEQAIQVNDIESPEKPKKRK